MKKIDDMNDFEILGVDPEADSTEIYMAYIQAKNALKPESMAFYALMTENEKERLRIRIEMAYHNLVSEKKRSDSGKEFPKEPKDYQQLNTVFGETDLIREKKDGTLLPFDDMQKQSIIEQPVLTEMPTQSSSTKKTLRRNILLRLEKWIFLILLFLVTLSLFGFIISLIPEKEMEKNIPGARKPDTTETVPVEEKFLKQQDLETSEKRTAPDKKNIPGARKPDTTETVPVEEKFLKQQDLETSEKRTAPDKKNIHEARKPEATEPVFVEEKPLKEQDADTSEKKIAPEKETGYYVVKKGESLSDIAKKEAVYGNALKWTILYRLNVDKLIDAATQDDFPDRKISEGLKLKVVTFEEVKENLKKRSGNEWVVNLLSSTGYKEIVQATLQLIPKGYFVYITTVRMKGKDWMRLRLGFFKNKKDADENGEKIKTLINAADYWSTKPNEKEIEAFGGY